MGEKLSPKLKIPERDGLVAPSVGQARWFEVVMEGMAGLEGGENERGGAAARSFVLPAFQTGKGQGGSFRRNVADAFRWWPFHHRSQVPDGLVTLSLHSQHLVNPSRLHTPTTRFRPTRDANYPVSLGSRPT